MMLDVRSWVFKKLVANTPLVNLVGSTNQIVSSWPNTSDKLPLVTFYESNQPTPGQVFFDNQPNGVESTINIDVWTGTSTDPGSISQAVTSVMKGLLFSVEFSADVPDPDTKIRRRSMRFKRVVSPQDLV